MRISFVIALNIDTIKLPSFPTTPSTIPTIVRSCICILCRQSITHVHIIIIVTRYNQRRTSLVAKQHHVLTSAVLRPCMTQAIHRLVRGLCGQRVPESYLWSAGTDSEILRRETYLPWSSWSPTQALSNCRGIRSACRRQAEYRLRKENNQ